MEHLKFERNLATPSDSNKKVALELNLGSFCLAKSPAVVIFIIG